MKRLLAERASVVAPRLLGGLIVHDCPEGTVAIELTEVEAYEGSNDPASHAARGVTPRNRIMFGEAGRLYVYRSYGLHWAINVVTGPAGVASAVLLRAGRVVEGIELARARRGPAVSDRGLARGPGCLSQALGVTGEHNDTDLTSDGPLRLVAGQATRPLTGPRVGVTRGSETPWRFWLPGEPTVSAYRRSPTAPPGRP